VSILNSTRKKRKKNTKKLLGVKVVGATANKVELDEIVEDCICCGCLGDEFLKTEIIKLNRYSNCYVCGNDSEPVINLEELVHRTHEVLQNNYHLTNDYPEGYECSLASDRLWERKGQEVELVIEDLLSVSESLANLIVEQLSNFYDATGKDALCDPQLYSFDPYYAENSLDDFDFFESWNNFKLSVGRETRYFNEYAKEILDHLFKGVGEAITTNKEPVVRVISTETDFYRSRVAKSSGELEDILKKLPSSIGPPSEVYSRSGRMNAHGISVFYGAFHKNTCLAEVRPPVGSHVVTGIFNPLRELRMLDLTRFESINLSHGSLFDDEHVKSIGRRSFLKYLTMELSAPVMPGDEDSEYIATQVVADYLATNSTLNLDGLIFKSSQDSMMGSGVSEDVANNVVLFYEASRLNNESYSEGKNFDLDLGWSHNDDEDLSITLYEKLLPEKESCVSDGMENELHSKYIDGQLAALVGPTISLKMDSVEVDDVVSVNVSLESRSFKRVKHEFNNSKF
jgi:hypothetical protein